MTMFLDDDLAPHSGVPDDGPQDAPAAPPPENCIDCPQHRIVPDADPDDDIAVACALAPREPNMASRHGSDRVPMRPVTVACRPHRARNESSRPDWCPLMGAGVQACRPEDRAMLQTEAGQKLMAAVVADIADDDLKKLDAIGRVIHGWGWTRATAPQQLDAIRAILADAS